MAEQYTLPCATRAGEDAPAAVGVGNVTDEEDQADGELVSVCRRMRLEHFYGSLRPALMKDAENMIWILSYKINTLTTYS